MRLLRSKNVHNYTLVLLLSAILLLTLLSCSGGGLAASDDTNNTSTTSTTSTTDSGTVTPEALTPSSWIIGTWAFSVSEWTFTSDNVIQSVNGIEGLNMKDQNAAFAAAGSPNTGYFDSEPNPGTVYRIDIKSAGSITATYTYTRTSATTFNFFDGTNTISYTKQ